MKPVFFSVLLFWITHDSNAQLISELYPLSGAAFFPVLLQGSGLTGLQNVEFEGGEAVCFSVNPEGTRVHALAPPGVKTGPIRFIFESGSIQSEEFTVIPGASPVFDFQDRDTLPQTELPPDQWCNTDSWGPDRRAGYPSAPPPPDGVDPKLWRQARILGAALKWRYFPYQHHHIPAFDATVCSNFSIEHQVGPGLDCSNYTTWIYLYAFNHHMSSGITTQAGSDETGRLLAFDEPLEPGDLIFSKGSPTGTRVTHVSVYISPYHIIDETAGFCDIRPWGVSGWPYNSFHSARRPLDNIAAHCRTTAGNDQPEIKIFPNPAYNEIRITGLTKGDVLEIHTLQGTCLYKSDEVSGRDEQTLNVSHLAPGFYILVVKGRLKTSSLPFIKSAG